MGQELIIASRVDIFKNLYLIGEVISEGREKKDLTTSVKGRCFTCFFFVFFTSKMELQHQIQCDYVRKEISIFFTK